MKNLENMKLKIKTVLLLRMAHTGERKGRSAEDKYFVHQEPSCNEIWWGDINRKMIIEDFDYLFNECTNFMKNKPLYVYTGYCGACEQTRIKVRFIVEHAWQYHFLKNMFINDSVLNTSINKDIDFTIINASGYKNEKYKEMGLNSSTFVTMNIEQKVGLIGGTYYGGEMKKAIFSLMNYLLPKKDIMTMHCSANKCKNNGDTAIFFGLSGTGKTTLSTDPNRLLIGDDEHLWSKICVANLEGGCYAKTVNLSAEKEPDIYNAIKKDAIMENVFLDKNYIPDYYNKTMTENGRVSYPLSHIDNKDPLSLGNQPTCVIFLCCDAFGVLPPISKLNAEEAKYYFISGYTAKVAGTEVGIKEPVAAFSPCFGAAFMPHHPTVYANILAKKIKETNVRTYLVNTGWSGGQYGIGKRMDIPVTRQCINSILDGSIENTIYTKDPNFGFLVPDSIDGIDKNILWPKNTWKNKDAYDEMVQKLLIMFDEHYKKIMK